MILPEIACSKCTSYSGESEISWRAAGHKDSGTQRFGRSRHPEDPRQVITGVLAARISLRAASRYAIRPWSPRHCGGPAHGRIIDRAPHLHICSMVGIYSHAARPPPAPPCQIASPAQLPARPSCTLAGIDGLPAILQGAGRCGVRRRAASQWQAWCTC